VPYFRRVVASENFSILSMASFSIQGIRSAVALVRKINMTLPEKRRVCFLRYFKSVFSSLINNSSEG